MSNEKHLNQLLGDSDAHVTTRIDYYGMPTVGSVSFGALMVLVSTVAVQLTWFVSFWFGDYR